MQFGMTERGDAGLDFAWEEFKGPKILITKAPQNLLDRNLDKCIVHCTITGFGGGILEPNVSKPEVTLEAYSELIRTYGEERIVLRVDPIIPTYKGLNTAKKVLCKAQGRIRISFFDAYPHVNARFHQKGLSSPYGGDLHAPLIQREAALKELEEYTGRTIEVCGEPGMKCTGCLSFLDFAALELEVLNCGKSKQRPACCCLAAKTELLSNKKPCEHNCLYCYWR